MIHKDQLHDIAGAGGKRTKGGIHAVKWKSFMFKAGTFIPENCALCPQTAALLQRIPRIKQAFFSILDPDQHIKTHKGYYYGFLRYHLGLIIPYHNQHKECWIRIHADPDDNRRYDKSSIVKGEKYHWQEGKGILFNDNYLHEAANESDQLRVVLYLDVIRKYPWWLDWFNLLLLNIGYSSAPVKRIAKDARVKLQNAG
jgi:beta-hydroxylase